jgi:hypothetical protein
MKSGEDALPGSKAAGDDGKEGKTIVNINNITQYPYKVRPSLRINGSSASSLYVSFRVYFLFFSVAAITFTQIWIIIISQLHTRHFHKCKNHHVISFASVV